MDSQDTLNAATQDSPFMAPPSRKKRKIRWPAITVLLLIAAGAFYYLNSGEEAEEDQPLISTVTVGSIENTISSAGTLQPFEYVDVGAQVSGQLEKLYVEVGDVVEEGDILAEIDARTQQSRVDASRSAIEAQEAQLSSRRASLELARTNALRQERLMAANATSHLDYDTAQNTLVSAEASLIQLEKQIEQARASLLTEETELEFTRILAPMAGTVVSIEMNEGRTLNVNQQAPTVLRIADLSTMTVEAEISEADIGDLRTGMEIYFTTLSGGTRRWTGSLRQILPTPVVESNVVLYTGLFDVDNSDGSLLPEMTAQVFFITSAARDVLTAPLGALTFLDADELAAQRTAARGDGEGPTVDTAAAQQRRPGSGQRPTGARRPPRPSSDGSTTRSFATAQVLQEDGTTEQRRVVVGVTSRVNAEVISGLDEGDQIVAGIVQAARAATTQETRPRGFPGGFQ